MFARASLFRCARALRRLLVWQSDGCVGGGGFSVDRLVATRDGEAVVGGASAVDAGVEGDGCGVTLNSGMECVGAGFAAVSPGGTVRGGVAVGAFARVCSRVGVVLFDHGLGGVGAPGLFAGVLDASVGDPRVCDGAERFAGRDGGGVSACWSVVVALVVVEGCVDGDSVAVIRFARVCVRDVRTVARIRFRSRVACEGEDAVFGGNDGFTDQHVGERLLFTRNPFVDLALCERYADGGEGLAPVARCGEGAGGDVGVPGADGGGHGFALVEEDECEARDGARVAHVGVEVCSFDDAPVGFRAHRLNACVLVAVVCARCVGGYTSGVAAECDGEVGAVAECDDVSVVVLDVAAVEELVEGGGEMVLVAGGVLCGACWCEAVFDVVPRVHGSLLFLSVVFCLFSCALVACCLPRACGESRGRSIRSRGRFPFRARFFVRHGIMVKLLLAKYDCRRLLWTVSCLVRA